VAVAVAVVSVADRSARVVADAIRPDGPPRIA